MPKHTKPIVLVAAMDQTRAIGRGNEIPWHIPGEQRRFKELTMGNALIMGRLTYESIRMPLPGRHSIVVSRSCHRLASDLPVAASVDDAIAIAEAMPGHQIMIGGGQQIYELFLPMADRIHLTEIQAVYGGDRYFPKIGSADFRLTASEPIRGDVPYIYFTYERKR